MRARKKLVAAIVAGTLIIAGAALKIDLQAVSGPLTEVLCNTVVECVSE